MSARHSTDSRSPGKPERPPGEKTLFWHQSGRWCKKIKGRLVYFGRGTYAAALASYNQQAEDLHAGRMPKTEQDPAGLTVYRLVAKFLTAKLADKNNGELSTRSYDDYGRLGKMLNRVLGRHRLVSDLRPVDFAKLRAAMAKRWGPVRLKAEIYRARVPFNWAHGMALIANPIVYGDGFKVPKPKTIREHKEATGPKMFEASEIRKILDAAGQPLRAMILLGLNSGFGNSDVATLPLSALDLDGGWVRHARPKTGIGRRCPLWSETVEALREAIAARPEPKKAADGKLVFLTKYGAPWDAGPNHRPLPHEMRKLLDQLGIKGRGYYALRHTFQTIGDECNDFIAVRVLMGHSFSGDISATYREKVGDDRLRKVTDHVHAWLFADPDGGKGAEPAKEEKPKLRIVG